MGYKLSMGFYSSNIYKSYRVKFYPHKPILPLKKSFAINYFVINYITLQTIWFDYLNWNKNTGREMKNELQDFKFWNFQIVVSKPIPHTPLINFREWWISQTHDHPPRPIWSTVLFRLPGNLSRGCGGLVLIAWQQFWLHDNKINCDKWEK